MLNMHVDVSGIVPWGQNAKGAVRRAARKAGATAIRDMRATASRLIRERKSLQVSMIGKGLSIIYPGGGKDALLWKVKASNAPMPLFAFKHSRVQLGAAKRNAKTGRFKKGRKVEGGRGGVRVEVNKGSNKLVRGAFLATMKSGHEGIFKREGKKRLKIHELFSSRVGDAFRDAMPAVANRGRVSFGDTFRRVLPLEVARRSAAA